MIKQPSYAQYGKFSSTTQDALLHWCAEWARRIAAASLHRTALNSAQKKLRQIYCVCLRKIFLSSYFKHFIDHFLATSLIFVDLFCFFGHFLDLLGQFHQSHAPRFPYAPRIPRLWCDEFGASHVTPDVPRNSWRNPTTMPDIFGIACIFPSLVICPKDGYGSEHPLFVH